MLIFLIYLGSLVQTLPPIATTTLIVSAMVFVILTGFIVLAADEKSENVKEAMDYLRKVRSVSIVAFSVALSIVMITPKPAAYYGMLAVYAGQTVVENPQVKQLVDKAVQAMDTALDDIIEQNKSNNATKEDSKK